MKTIIAFFSLLLLAFSVAAQTTTCKDKRGNTVGYVKQDKNKATYYDKSHNKTGFSRKTGNTITYYDKRGNKVGSVKIKK